MYITRDELAAAIETAHARGLKVTGHLCSVTYPEAAALGIDDLEHGFFVEHAARSREEARRVPGEHGRGRRCRRWTPGSVRRRSALFALLVERHVAVTSTLPGLRAPRAEPPPAAVAGPRGDEPAGARGVSLIARSRPRRASPPTAARRVSPRDGARARLRRGRRAAARRPRPDRERRHRAGLLRPARARAARGGGLLAGRGDPDRQLQRSDLPRAARPDRLASSPARAPTWCW